MATRADLEIVKHAVAELNEANIILQESLVVWSESISNMHKAELAVRGAHRGVLKAQAMLTTAINNNLGEDLDKLKR